MKWQASEFRFLVSYQIQLYQVGFFSSSYDIDTVQFSKLINDAPSLKIGFRRWRACCYDCTWYAYRSPRTALHGVLQSTRLRAPELRIRAIQVSLLATYCTTLPLHQYIHSGRQSSNVLTSTEKEGPDG